MIRREYARHMLPHCEVAMGVWGLLCWVAVCGTSECDAVYKLTSTKRNRNMKLHLSAWFSYTCTRLHKLCSWFTSLVSCRSPNPTLKQAKFYTKQTFTSHTQKSMFVHTQETSPTGPVTIHTSYFSSKLWLTKPLLAWSWWINKLWSSHYTPNPHLQLYWWCKCMFG